MLLPLVLILIVVPLVELYVIIKVGQAIGPGPTIAILLVDSIVGAMLMRSQGRAAWERFNRAVSEGRIPHREVIDGVLVIMGGALLLTPGFVTDVFGIALLVPPIRDLIRAISTKLAVGRFGMGARVAYWGYGKARGAGARGRSAPNGRGAGPGWRPPSEPAANGPRPDDIEGTAEEIEDRDELGR